MSQIFISYAREDIEFAGKIVDALAKNKLETWLDWKNLPKGEKVQEEIYHAIEQADIFLFLVSPDSVKSPWCQKEIEHAIRNNKRLIPIIIRDTNEKNIPIEIRDRNWIFCRKSKDHFEIAIAEMFNAISNDYQWVKYHTRLLVKALDWERQKDNSRLLRGKELQEAERQLTSEKNKKDPQPTNLQRKYISISRKEEQNRQKIITRSILGTFAIICILCTVAVVGGGVGYFQNRVAATAQIQVTEQKNIADTRQLATIANNLSLEDGYTATLSGLLAIEAAKRYPELDSDQAIRRFLSVYTIPIINFQVGSEISREVLFSPSGQWVAVVPIQDNLSKIDVWDIETGAKIIQLKAGYPLDYMAFSPDGNWLLTIDCVNQSEGLFSINCTRMNAHVWNTNTWVEVPNAAQGTYVNTAVFSPDSKLVISDGENRDAIVWETATGKIISYLHHKTDEESYGVSAVNFSPNGKLIVSGGTSDFTSIVWNLTTSQKISQMNHDGEVEFNSFSNNNKMLVSGGYTNNVIVWDVLTGEEISRLTLDGSAYSSNFTSDDEKVITEAQFEIIIWDIATGSIVYRIPRNIFSINNDVNQIFTVGGFASIWDIATGSELKRGVYDGSVVAYNFDGSKVAFYGNKNIYITKFPNSSEYSSMLHEGSVESVDISPDGQWAVSGGHDGTTRVWNLETGEEISRMSVDGLVVSVDFSKDGKWVAQAACEGVSEGYVNCGKAVVRIWEAETGKQLYQLMPDFGVTTIKLVPNSLQIVIAGSNRSLELWDLELGRAISSFQLDLPEGEFTGQAAMWINSFDIDPFGRWIVVEGQVLALKSGKEVYRLIREEGGSLDYFSPSGNWIASPDGPNIRIWNPENGDELIRIPLNPLTEGVSNLVFSQDEKWLIGEGKNTIHVWEISTGREIARIETGQLNSIAISPDGRFIVSGSSDKTASVWLWRSDDLINEVCKRLPRNLTQEEWHQFIGAEPYKPTCPNLPDPTP